MPMFLAFPTSLTDATDGHRPDTRDGTERAQPNRRENPRRLGTPYFADEPLPRDATFWQRRAKCLDKHTARGDGCWEWTAGKNQHGYGLCGFAVNGKRTTRGAHRLQWERFFGPPPAGMVVMHDCDNPGCVKPAHLIVGTPAKNVAEK